MSITRGTTIRQILQPLGRWWYVWGYHHPIQKFVAAQWGDRVKSFSGESEKVQ